MAQAPFKGLGQKISPEPESIPVCFLLRKGQPVSQQAMVGACIDSKDGLDGVNEGFSCGGGCCASFSRRRNPCSHHPAPQSVCRHVSKFTDEV